MKRRVLVVTPRLGLHARPANLFAQTSARFRSDIKVRKEADGEEIVINGKSIMGLMMLAAACGESVEVLVDGPDEDEAIKKIEELFIRKFDEE